ncbi:biotin synthase [Helicobacter kayseriensis]|uniref:biotin synthase n=1 Tax=Helicobacter kayseriensis TaxID=2905877 RepID=UPI001E33EBC1|nr:biotin synthase [Helicobacter kayseriensis]MCE3046709.1 biotin synthase [Helicobacter kayseriensis]MCE3047989.1 biotin synthase [Helicobacter kayseriensis]
MKKEVFLCSISNVSSGGCSEDCAYCTQSAHYETNVQRYKYKNPQDVIAEARELKKYGMVGFCLVTSGRGLDSKKCEYVASLAQAIKKEIEDIHLIACCGRADEESLKHIKAHGIDTYNHNLESAQSFFSSICTTHTWEERFETCENALRAGLGLCSGGIFGLGEEWKHRIELLKALRSLSPHSVPINFFIPHPALPLKREVLSKEEALECIVLTKEYLPNSRLMIAGGRERVFGLDQKKMFDYGINAIVLGNYLTTLGETPQKDLEMLEKYDLQIMDIKKSLALLSHQGLGIAKECR